MDGSMCDIFVVSLLVEEIEKNNRIKLQREQQWVDSFWANRNLVGEIAILVSQLKQNDIKFKEHFRINLIYPGTMQVVTCHKESRTIPVQRCSAAFSVERGGTALNAAEQRLPRQNSAELYLKHSHDKNTFVLILYLFAAKAE
ncbi:hypothetical protein PYW07_000004 [Mythimna separata]|uniref:Uncharacterized protein n=1 Tax=Mythimna separata TaxID=271217 RepID=A0AAD8E042_MYTSE|nr:hypothetical protein PYW07_000004 [Mythimna separata]